jgi:hypothetical protein
MGLGRLYVGPVFYLVVLMCSSTDCYFEFTCCIRLIEGWK